MNKEKAIIKAEMTSKGDNHYGSSLEIKGSGVDILNLLKDIVRSLMKTEINPLSIVDAFITGMEEKENGKSDC